LKPNPTGNAGATFAVLFSIQHTFAIRFLIIFPWLPNFVNRLKARIRSYFGFSRTETNGFLILLPLMALLLFSEPLYQLWFSHPETNAAKDSRRLDSLIAQWTWSKHNDSVTIQPVRLFSFDPNKALAKDFRALGLAEKLSRQILNYRTKGGKFKVKNDFKKIYGMDSVIARKLYPFIDLPEQRPKKLPHAEKALPKSKEPFDLNQADSAQLVRVYGIGPRLSRRIITYRNRLGGFISMDQLAEVYGLDSAAIDEVKKNSFIDPGFRPKQININQAGKKELASLPYIKFTIAQAITAYRYQHGDFKSVDELTNVVLVDALTFQKIKPYLTTKE